MPWAIRKSMVRSGMLDFRLPLPAWGMSGRSGLCDLSLVSLSATLTQRQLALGSRVLIVRVLTSHLGTAGLNAAATTDPKQPAAQPQSCGRADLC